LRITFDAGTATKVIYSATSVAEKKRGPTKDLHSLYTLAECEDALPKKRLLVFVSYDCLFFTIVLIQTVLSFISPNSKILYFGVGLGGWIFLVKNQV
jgi:hypothetical protein